jgi:hypothetical protein
MYSLKEEDHLEKLCIGGSVSLKWILKELDERVWIGLIWLLIRISKGFFLSRYLTFGFHKMRGILPQNDIRALNQGE